jgi:predicted PurR-regulated permease PerM
VALVVPPTVNGTAGLEDASAGAIQDVEDWLVEGPLGLQRDDVRQYTSDPAGQVIEMVEASSLSISSGAKLVGETLVVALLALVLTFYFLKDGRRLQRWVLERLGDRRGLVVRRMSARAWSSFGGYLRGSATLGAIEGVVIGGAMTIVGAPLGLAMGVITFMAAFFPIVGATVAGGLAVLVTLTAAGAGPALVVLAVAVAVQQLDNDVLGPWVFGTALDIHPVAILLVLTAGASLGGIVGAFVAVPLAGAVAGAAQEFWNEREIVDRVGAVPAARTG